MLLSASNTLTFLLLGAGAAGWVAMSRPLAGDASLHIPPNPLGIKRSPYGEVFALGMQGPIETYFHAGDACADKACGDPAHRHDQAAAEPARKGFAGYLDGLNSIATQRTNPAPPSKALRFKIRQEVEKKLRFAYELDPSNYANYNSYHLFLTEPQVGTGGRVLTAEAQLLSRETVAFCLSREDDPRPALTAAAATENEMILMSLYPDKYTLADMRGQLDTLDRCIARYHELADRWAAGDGWRNVSPQRLNEHAERLQFVMKLREAAEATVTRLEKNPNPGQAANRSATELR